MENHDTTQRGTVVVGTYAANGSVSSSSTFNNQLSLRDVVSGYTLVKGDKTKPTPFAYNTSRDLTYRGKWDLFLGPPYNRLTDFAKGVIGTTLSSRLTTLSWERQASYNKALSKLIEKCRGSLDLSVSVAESHETMRMLNVYDRISRYFEGVPPAKASFRWTQPLRELGGKWLEWHLGLRPLLEDLYGSIDEFYRHKVPALLEVNAKFYKTVGHVPVAKLYSNDPQSWAVGGGKQGCYMAIRFKDKGGFDLKRWTSLNPASLAWELLPLSYVIDYFYDIGNMLRNLESSLLYDSAFVDGYYTELYSVHYSHRELGPRGRNQSGNGSAYLYDMTASYDDTRFVRVVLSSMPLPRPPTFVLPTSWQKLVTMAALCAVRLDPHAKRKSQ